MKRYLLPAVVGQQMQLPGLEAVLTFTFVENVGLKFVAGARRLLSRHVWVLCPGGGG